MAAALQAAERGSRARLLSLQQMERNTLKALKGHAHLPWNFSALSAPRALGDRSWRVLMGVCALQGARPTMEDCHLEVDTKYYGVWFVFDGFGGATAAERARDFCQQAIPSLLEGMADNPKQALEDLCAEMGRQLSSESSGSTVQGCVFDKGKGLLYTASLGDGGAFLWRQNTTALAPLSCVRDFTYRKESERAAQVYRKHQEKVVREQLKPGGKSRADLMWAYDFPLGWTLAQGHARELGLKPSVISKAIGLPAVLIQALEEGRRGLNLARGVGGRDYQGFLSTHPKVSVTEVRMGDVLIVASDGWTDALAKIFHELQEGCLRNFGSPQRVAEQLAKRATTERGLLGDNVTVSVIWFQ